MRVLAVTADASLLVSLHSVLRGWEVSIVRDPEDAASAAAGASILLVDYGSTELGLEIAERVSNMGVEIPCLIVGDRGAPSTDARILVRPFGIDDLVGAVLEIAGTPAAAPLPPDHAPEETPAAAPPASARPRAAAPKPTRAARPPEPDNGSRAKPPATARRPASQRREQRQNPRADQQVGRPSVKPEAEPVKPLRRETVRPAQPAASRKPAAAQKPGPAAKPAAGRRPAAQPSASSDQPMRTAPAWPPASAEPPPAVTGRGARNVLAPARPSRRPAEPRRSLFKRSAAGSSPDAFAARLRNALAGVHEIEALLAEVPPLGRPRTLATALLADLAARFEPDIAAVYTRGADGSYQVLASHGLTAIEALMRVDGAQPLFRQVAGEREAILIAPVDLAGALVDGITIARTDALAAVPFVVDKACYGVLVVGRSLLGEPDLDQLAALAQEAAPGLAFAQALENLALR